MKNLLRKKMNWKANTGLVKKRMETLLIKKMNWKSNTKIIKK